MRSSDIAWKGEMMDGNQGQGLLCAITFLSVGGFRIADVKGPSEGVDSM